MRSGDREAAPHPSLLARKVVHVDMDAFYAAVEVRDDPALRGRPVVVGGTPEGRGVVCTASYEARRYGIHSAMPAARARRLCPDAVFLRPRFDAYAAEAERIRAIFARHTDRIEPLSLDEAYLDVTRHPDGLTATEAARRIRAAIREVTGLTASAGAAPNKMLAKIASDVRKPDGLTVVRPESARAFLRALPVRRIPGVGPVTAERLAAMGIRTCGDAWGREAAELAEAFGRLGLVLHERLAGIDERPVVTSREPRSIGHEDTFPQDRADLPGLRAHLGEQAGAVAARLRERGLRARTVVLKVRYADLTRITRSFTLERPTDNAAAIAGVAADLLERTEVGRGREARLIGVAVSGLTPPLAPAGAEGAGGRQLTLFQAV